LGKAGQDVFTSPAAIYVITQEEIRQSGLDILPEWFRLSPGVHVGHINASTWGIAIRGLNAEFNNRLLVLIDGRSIYTPGAQHAFWGSISRAVRTPTRAEDDFTSGGGIILPNKDLDSEELTAYELGYRDKLELNSSLYYTDNVSRWAAPSGVRLDVGLVYRPGKNLEFNVVGQYFLDSQQGPEMTARNTSQVVEPQRAVFAHLSISFDIKVISG